jgi:hypothetical protein
MPNIVSEHELRAMGAYWRGANYLSVGPRRRPTTAPEKNCRRRDAALQETSDAA